MRSVRPAQRFRAHRTFDFGGMMQDGQTSQDFYSTGASPSELVEPCATNADA
jgi:hypothetical protein